MEQQEPADALAVVLNERGRVDLDHIAELLHREYEDVVAELGSAIFRDPADGSWQTADAYLSGPVRDKLAIAEAAQPREILYRVESFQTSAFAIDMGDNAVDSIFCMRLLHHIADPAHRLAMLREFHRVTRDTLIVSLWVDGNYKAWKRKRLERRRPAKDNQNRFVVERSVIEAEFAEAGFDILDRSDFLPGYAMWRVYVLRKRG